tara:strand:+ start:930 stop:1115 length:186 start_codon:yes stop_codon:yes gene_type:complete
MSNQIEQLYQSIFVFLISFGELEISTKTVIFLISLTSFTFLAVGISSFKLVQSAVEKKKKD